MYEHVHGNSGCIRIPIRVPSGAKRSILQGWANNTQHTDAHILEHRNRSNKRVKRRVNTLWTESQTTPRLGYGIFRRVDVTAAVTALNLYINVIRISMILRCTLVQQIFRLFSCFPFAARCRL